MIRRIIITLITLAFSTATAIAGELQKPAAAAPATQPTARNESAFQPLDKLVPDADFRDMPISDAMDWLRKLDGIHIFVNWRGLELAGIDRNLPITLHLKNKSVADILNLMLGIAGIGKQPLAYSVEDNIITISTFREMQKNTLTRVYDIRRILNAAQAMPYPARVDHIEKLLMDQVDPASWRARSGEVGAMRELQGQLIVTQTKANQEKLELLVKDLTSLLSTNAPRK